MRLSLVNAQQGIDAAHTASAFLLDFKSIGRLSQLDALTLSIAVDCGTQAGSSWCKLWLFLGTWGGGVTLGGFHFWTWVQGVLNLWLLLVNRGLGADVIRARWQQLLTVSLACTCASRPGCLMRHNSSAL